MIFIAILLIFAHAGERSLDYSQCKEPSDYGYPRFNSYDELTASPWGAYLLGKYGALPTKYPFCVYDLWYIDATQPSYPALGLKPDPSKASMVNDLNRTWHKGDYNNGDFFQTDFGMWIYHDDEYVVKNDTWMEVQHMLFPYESKAMWFTRARGSGIWYNVGRTISFVSDNGHNAAYDYFAKHGCVYPPTPIPPKNLNCSDPAQVDYCLKIASAKENAMAECAAKMGYESVQFASAPGPIINTFGHVGWLELLSTSLVGKYACGTPKGGTSGGFRYGWYASEKCDCIEGGYQYAPLNCNGNKNMHTSRKY